MVLKRLYLDSSWRPAEVKSMTATLIADADRSVSQETRLTIGVSGAQRPGHGVNGRVGGGTYVG